MISGLKRATAQDVHFSHIHASPIHLNPGLTGVFQGDHRVIMNYKNQWRNTTANYNTIAASVDGKITYFGNGSSLNYGLSMYGDRAGDLDYTIAGVYGNLGIAQSLGGDGNNFISLGVQSGMWHQSADLTKMDVFDPEPQIGNYFNQNTVVFDISLGGAWYYQTTKGFGLYLGGSVFHLNEPNIVTNVVSADQDDVLPRRYVFHGGAEMIFGKEKKFGILPSFAFMDQGPYREINVGAFMRFNIAGNKRRPENPVFYFGVWNRFYAIKGFNDGTDAVIMSLRVDHRKMICSFSYDVTISALTAANTFTGGPELSIIWITGEKDRKGKTNKTVYCPVF
jgi:type IX secretion system PorP/SprF family membrane protein